MIRVLFSKQRGTMPLRNRRRFEKILRRAPAIVGLEGNGILTVILTAPDTMAEINSRYVGHTGTTDVITFDLRADAIGIEDDSLGEIYVCPDVALEYARQHGLDPSVELVLYAIHGMLHLHGEDDIKEDDRRQMRKAEARVMAALGQEFDLSDFIGE